MTAGYVIADTLAVVDENSYLRVLLADGRVLGTPAVGAIAGTEELTLNVGGVTKRVSLVRPQDLDQ